jgi:two pore calcium channel protein
VYIYNNFNDFPSGLVTLFELMVVNNWWVIAEMYVDVTSKWSRLFFALFYFLAVLIVLNLLVAFVLDMFTS